MVAAVRLTSILSLGLACFPLVAAPPEEKLIETYQLQVDKFLLKQDYPSAIQLMEQFRRLYPNNFYFDKQLLSTKALLEIQQLDPSQPVNPTPKTPPPPPKLAPPQPVLNLQLDGGAKIYTKNNKDFYANYLLRAKFEFFPIRNEHNLGVLLGYRGSLLQFAQEGRLVDNLLAGYLQPKISVWPNERGSLDLKIPLGLGFLLHPFAPSADLFLLTLGITLRDNLLYHALGWQPAANTYLDLGLTIDFSPESNVFSSQLVELGIAQKVNQFEFGLAYMFQNQRWGNDYTSLHHLLAHFAYTFSQPASSSK